VKAGQFHTLRFREHANVPQMLMVRQKRQKWKCWIFWKSQYFLLGMSFKFLNIQLKKADQK